MRARMALPAGLRIAGSAARAWSVTAAMVACPVSLFRVPQDGKVECGEQAGFEGGGQPHEDLRSG